MDYKQIALFFCPTDGNNIRDVFRNHVVDFFRTVDAMLKWVGGTAVVIIAAVTLSCMLSDKHAFTT